MKCMKWMHWNERIATNDLKWRNWNERIGMKELKWKNWHEGIEVRIEMKEWMNEWMKDWMNELKWMNWNEWIEMIGLKWMTSNEWIEIQEWKRMNCQEWSETPLVLPIFFGINFCWHMPSREFTRSRSLTLPNYLMMIWLTWWCGCHDDWDDDVFAMMVRQIAIDNRPWFNSFLTKLPLIICM